MTGAEHYAQAELILQRAAVASGHMLVADSFEPEEMRSILASAYLLAQVHATLALTQATLATFEAADWDRKEP